MCGGSPLCHTCGHPRRDHVRVFVQGGRRECRRRIGDFQTLSSAACECTGYVPVEGSLADALFAAPDFDYSEEPFPQLRLGPRPGR